jgi:hypothetical protein
MSVEEKLDSLRLEYLAHASVAVQNEGLAKQLGRRLLEVCPNKNTRLIEYFCCLRCGLPRARDGNATQCSGCRYSQTSNS